MIGRLIVRGGITLLAAGLLAGWGCATGMGGQKIPLTSTERAPAAKGEIQAKVTDEGNTEFSLNVEHLAPPDRLASGAQSYVVWVQPMEGDQRPQNLGALELDVNRRTGRFKGITPYHRFQLSITPEQNITAEAPTGNPVLSAQVFGYQKQR